MNGKKGIYAQYMKCCEQFERGFPRTSDNISENIDNISKKTNTEFQLTADIRRTIHKTNEFP